jgi:hypothetical protein
MAFCTTIFGVAKRGENAVFCYGFIRPVRRSGNYPPPALPKEIAFDGVRRVPIEGYDIELVTWDQILDDGACVAVDAALKDGKFLIPAGCPIEGGAEVTGSTFGPILIMEAQDRVRASGAGILEVIGIARADGVERVRQKLAETVTPAVAPAALAQLIDMILTQSGLGVFFKERRRIGIIDRFSRTADGADGPLFVVLPEKPDFRKRDPMRRVQICREAAAPDRSYRLHVVLRNFHEVLSDFLIDIAAGQSNVFCEVNGHVTDVTLSAFDGAGKLADHLSGAFIQGFDFGIVAQGRSDTLPPAFAGAPQSADLEKRPRIHTTAFKGPAAGDRSGGLDVVRRQRDQVSKLIGTSATSLENVWIERGGEGQIDVIRWIKTKIERPGATSAYLIDPYLGSDALRRVIARQGHENMALTIVVSPGGINPDANELDVKATDDHLATLRAAADEWADRLCGQISIIHIRRGERKKQAFHDRYLSIVDQQGVPTVYLLSNSLNKAAGDWPFAISELDRIASWRVQGYIEALIAGQQGELHLHPELVWKSAEPTSSVVAPPMANAADPAQDERPDWMKASNALLVDLWNVVVRTTDFEAPISERIDVFLKVWPPGVDTKSLAAKLFETVGHRDEAIVFVSKRFAMGTSEQIEVAQALDDLLLARLIAGLPQNDRPGTHYVFAKDRNALLQHVGRIIARKEPPANTNFVRDRLNPIMHELVQILELRRFDASLASEALETGVFLVSVGLEVAIKSEKADERFRLGIARDYIHWLARLTRSDLAESRYDKRLGLPDEGLGDLQFAVAQVVAARQALGEEIDESIKRLLDDPLVLPLVKDLLGTMINARHYHH